MYRAPVSVAYRRSSLSLDCVVWPAVAIGLAERIGWALARKTPWAVGEAPNVAIALAHGRGFADAFWVGQGATAHVLPVSPAIAGAVYALLGVRTGAAEALLCAWSIGVSLASYALLYACFARLGTPRWARVGALVALLVVPIYTTNEAFEFRVWDGGLGLLLGNLFLYLVLRAEDRAEPRGFAVWLALLPALTFFTSPPIGLAAYGAWALFVWRRRSTPAAIMRAAAGTLLALSLLIGPWTVRNALVMGHPIALRDDLGMELAVANHPAAVTGADRDATFIRRLQAIQPYIHPVAQRALVAAGGEVAYSQLLGRETKAWIVAHPGDFLRLSWRHFGEMLLPGTWMFSTSHAVLVPIMRACATRLVHVLGLLGLVAALIRRQPRFAYVLPFVVAPVLVYVPFQPIIRYTWLIFPMLAYCAADLIARLATRQSSSSS